MIRTYKDVLSPEEQAWVKQLSGEIWQLNESPGNVHGDNYRTEKRKLTKEEWKRLKKLIYAHELPCLPGGGTFGFGFSLTVCSHSPAPQVKPEPLITITGKHLPKVQPGHENWDQIWATFSPFTHAPRNIELLAFYGMEAPRERVHYEY